MSETGQVGALPRTHLTPITSFYRDKNNEATLKEHGFMVDWAEEAGKRVFQQVENVHEDNVVTFVNLSMFWFSQGSWKRAYIHRSKIPLSSVKSAICSLTQGPRQCSGRSTSFGTGSRKGRRRRRHMGFGATSPSLLGLLSDAL